MLTPDALRHPEQFIVQFAAAHRLDVQSPGAVVRTEQYERDVYLPPEHPDAWRVIREQGTVNLGRSLVLLSTAGLLRLRSLILEMGSSIDGRRPQAWTPQQRAVWCLAPHGLSAAEMNEICAVATAVAEGRAAPERALARLRSGASLEDNDYEQPTRSSMDPTPAVAPDRQLERLHLLNAVVFAQPYRTTDWMVRWAFLSLGRNRQHPRFTATVVWIRQALDVLAARAAEHVRAAARQYRDSFLGKIDPRTCPVPNGTFDLWAHGYGEVDDPITEARVAEQARAFPRKSIDHVRVALDGDAESLYEALREAGVAALRWPWVLRVLDGWREAIERLGGQDLKAARARMKGVSAALVHITGRGAVARPDRLALRTEAVRLAEAHWACPDSVDTQVKLPGLAARDGAQTQPG
jgi:hypothetical protein